MELSPKTVRKARDELREDPAKRSHSLQQFREFLKFHPFIKKCCTDDIFLLAFLRVRKFWNDEAFKVLENYLIFRHKNPAWFDLSEGQLQRYRELVKSGFLYISEERDFDGAAYMTCNLSKVDIDKFSIDDIFHCYFTSACLLVLDEKSQIGGLKGSLDGKNVSMRHVAIFPVAQVIDFTRYIANANALRMKGMFFVGAPSYATQIINVFKMALPEKIKRRVHFFKNNEELSKMINKRCLSKDAGGEVTEAQMIERHLRDFEEKLPQLRKIADFELIEANISQKSGAAESAGSFRKLNID